MIHVHMRNVPRNPIFGACDQGKASSNFLTTEMSLVIDMLVVASYAFIFFSELQAKALIRLRSACSLAVCNKIRVSRD